MPSPSGDAARRFVFLGLGAIACAAGCAGSGSDTRRRLDDLEQQVVLVQNRNDRLEERVAAVEAALDSERAQRHPAGDEELGAEEHSPQLPVVRLRPSSDEPVESDPKPDALESESANQPSGAMPPVVRPDNGQGAPKNSGSTKGPKKKLTPEADKPREVIKVHPEGTQSRRSAPAPGAPWEVQSTCPV